LFLYRAILFIARRKNMIRTIFTPDSQQITFPIPEKYIGTELEMKNRRASPAVSKISP
jgi:hypothetical protein